MTVFSDTQEFAYQFHGALAKSVVEKIPAQGAQQGYAASAEVGKKIILNELLPLPEHRLAFAHDHRDEIGLHHVPAATITFGEKRIASLVRIVRTEITNEALVIVILDVLQRGFLNHVAVSVFFVGITEQSK